MRAHLGAIAFFALAAIVMTWPLAANLPLAAAHPGDPYITSWMLDWGFHSLTHQPSRLFHANIFHPLPYTFAFSENLLGIVFVLSPLLAMKVPPLLLHNIAILFGFASAGYAAALLGRYLTGSIMAGIAGGFFFAFVPWRFTHLTHLQHLWTLWLPLLILAVLRLRDRPTWGRAAVLCFCFVMNGLTNLHWLAFGSIAAAVCAVICAFGDADRRRFRLPALTAFAIGTLLLLPLLLPYRKAGQLYGMRGDAAETLHYSAKPSDWLISSLHNRIYGPHLNDGTVDPERWSFPGLLGPLLALIGIATCWRRSRLYAIVGLVLVLLGFLGSLGLHSPFGRFLFEYLPPFNGIRVPARWAMIAYLGIAMLASLGTLALARTKWIVAMVIALLFVELRTAPIRWYLATGEMPPVYRWLAQQKIRDAVVELPMDQVHSYRAMFFSHLHHAPLINGVSGFKPPLHAELEDEWSRTPIPTSFSERLDRRGASVVIVHHDRLGPRAGAAAAWLRQEVVRGRLVHVGAFGNDAVYATPEQAATLTPIAPPPPSIEAALDHPVHWEEISGALAVSGSLQAPHPVRKVILHFDNHRTQFEADLGDGRFARSFVERPASVRADTGLQVEIIDERGNRKLLPQVWLRWRRPGERLSDALLPQTADLGPYLVHPRHEDDVVRPHM
jgi:multisubunit Na+/H+ antiporter MnhF subunit